MITAEKSIERVLAAKAAKGKTRATITNEELLGVRPKGELEEAGVDVLAKQRRDTINETLEQEHGIGLVPDDYHGRWKLVSIDERGAHMLLMRLRRASNLLEEQPNGDPSRLRATVDEYQNNPHVSDEFCKAMKRARRSVMALEIVAAEVIHPHIDRLEKLLISFKEE